MFIFKLKNDSTYVASLLAANVCVCVCWCFWVGASAHVGYQAPISTSGGSRGATRPQPPGAPAGAPSGPRPRGPSGSATDLYTNLVWVINDLKPNVT